MRTSLGVLLAAVLSLSAGREAAASVLIAVDETAQRMTVSVDGVPQFYWPVSTGKAGYETPTGDFSPMRMEREHYSREWDDAPMPYSIFFTDRGHAIHGSNETKRLGSPASRGCVRLEPSNAAQLFALVEAAGIANTRVVISAGIPDWDLSRRHPFAVAPSIVLGPEWEHYSPEPTVIYPEVYAPYYPEVYPPYYPEDYAPTYPELYAPRYEPPRFYHYRGR